MKNSKLIVLGGLLAVLSVLFQIIPVIFSELFTIITIFSALPIYISSRIKPIAGLSSFAAAALLIFLFSPHEGVFFIFTNGIIGLCLGLCRYYCIPSIFSVLTNSFLLLITLDILIYAFGINVFGFGIPFSFWLQSAITLAFCMVYSFVYLQFAEFIYARVNRFIAN